MGSSPYFWGARMYRRKVLLATAPATLLQILLPNGTRKEIGITRAHLEEDAGKLVHGGADALAGSTHSDADYNRAGVPLLEVRIAMRSRCAKRLPSIDKIFEYNSVLSTKRSCAIVFP